MSHCICENCIVIQTVVLGISLTGKLADDNDYFIDNGFELKLDWDLGIIDLCKYIVFNCAFI